MANKNLSSNPPNNLLNNLLSNWLDKWLRRPGAYCVPAKRLSDGTEGFATYRVRIPVGKFDCPETDRPDQWSYWVLFPGGFMDTKWYSEDEIEIREWILNE